MADPALPRSVLLKSGLTRTALLTPACVKSAACCTTNVHRSRKPTGDERTHAQDPDQDGCVQKKISQANESPLLWDDEPTRVHTRPGTACQVQFPHILVT